MSKNLCIQFLSLLCLHTVAVAIPAPGPGVPPAQSTYANRNVTLFSSGTMINYGNNNSVVITCINSGASADFDFGFKHVAIIGICVTVVALIVGTRDAHDIILNRIKEVWYRVRGLKKS